MRVIWEEQHFISVAALIYVQHDTVIMHFPSNHSMKLFWCLWLLHTISLANGKFIRLIFYYFTTPKFIMLISIFLIFPLVPSPVISVIPLMGSCAFRLRHQHWSIKTLSSMVRDPTLPIYVLQSHFPCNFSLDFYSKSHTYFIWLQACCVEYIILESDNLSSLFPKAHISLGGLDINSHQLFAFITALSVLPTVWLRDLSILSYISGECKF